MKGKVRLKGRARHESVEAVEAVVREQGRMKGELAVKEQDLPVSGKRKTLFRSRRSRAYALSMALLLLLMGCSHNSDRSTRPLSTPLPSQEANGQASSAPAPKDSEHMLSWHEDTSPFRFTQYFYGNWATSYLWKDQYDMKLITEKTGVKIDRTLATGSDEDYLNMMIATGELPDSLMLDWYNPAVSKLISSGLVYSMNDLIEKYAPEFWNMLDPNMVKYHSVNGKLWYLPNLYEKEDRMTNGNPIVSIRPWFIRKDLYEAIGQPVISTPDDLVQALHRIAAQFPDVTPLGLDFFDVSANGFEGSRSVSVLIDSFAPYLSEERIQDERKMLLYPMRNKGFMEAFRFLNRLYREGLLDPQLLIERQEQYEEKSYRGQFAVAAHFLDDLYTKYNPTIAKTLGESHTYSLLDGLKVNGQSPRYPATRLMGWQGFFITKKAKDPGRMIRFAEYAWSDEGQMDMRYGKLGETYDIVDGLPKLKPEIQEMQLKERNAWLAKYGFSASTLLWRSGEPWDEAETRNYKQQNPEEYAAAQSISSYNYDEYPLGMENLEPSGSSSEGSINEQIKELWNQTIPALVMAKSNEEFDSRYQEFLQQMEKAGAEQVERVMYERHLEDLAKKGLPMKTARTAEKGDGNGENRG